MKAKVSDLVAVTWLDTYHKDDLTEQEARELNPMQATSYGRLLVVNDSKVTVCGAEFNDAELREVSVIPAAVVVSIKKLQEV